MIINPPAKDSRKEEEDSRGSHNAPMEIKELPPTAKLLESPNRAAERTNVNIRGEGGADVLVAGPGIFNVPFTRLNVSLLDGMVSLDVLGSCFLFILQLIMITIGIVFIHDCPAQRYIPIFLIVFGVCGIIQKCLSFWPKMIVCYYIVDVFQTIWFITGCYWIYTVHARWDSVDHCSETFCDKTVYLFAFWLVSVILLIVGVIIVILVVLIICAIICSIFLALGGMFGRRMNVRVIS
ncbi:transmembrane protein 272-like [Parasteatoda tepidariorum]|uniref:transmembrane protein 272-like n=1 Tax=Parasteatoda tepidariorum TaxID=114398 RepID=UPI00077FBD5F|nr:transmembrane protein 272-like [Parasteatoda tepidariorum]